MNLRKKRELAARTLGVGKERVIFLEPRLTEIKEAITKQDIKDLHKDGAILLKSVKGQKGVVKRKHKKGAGNVRLKVNKRKKDYVLLTRKLRKHIKDLHSHGSLSKENKKHLRVKIRNSEFKTKQHLKDYIKENILGSLGKSEESSIKKTKKKVGGKKAK